MENVKNNFEELKKLLLGALEILEQTNSGLVERIEMLEQRVNELEQQVQELQQQRDSGVDACKAADNEAFVPTGVLPFVCSEESADVEAEEVPEKVPEEAPEEVPEKVPVEVPEKVPEEVSEDVADEIEDEEIEEIEEVAEDVEEEEIEEVAEEEAAPVEVEEEETAPVDVAEEVDEEVAHQEEEVAAEDEEVAEVAEAAEAVEVVEESVGAMMINDFVADERRRIVNEAAKPDWYDWEVDYPAEYVDDVYKGISFNDRYEFIKELFNVTGCLDDAEMAFKETLDAINSMEHFKQVVAYIRERFPQWDEQSDEVYRFYMAVRRKFNK